MSGPYVFVPGQTSAPSNHPMSGVFVYQVPDATLEPLKFPNREETPPVIPTVGIDDPSPPNTPVRDTRTPDEDFCAEECTRVPSLHTAVTAPFPNTPNSTGPTENVCALQQSSPFSICPSHYYREEMGPYSWVNHVHILNPLLCPGSIQLDLSKSKFRPLDADGEEVPLYLLRQPATSPVNGKLAIIATSPLPGPDSWFYPSPTECAGDAKGPVSLHAVLCWIHWMMHTRVTPSEWEALNHERKVEVGKAYNRRCKYELDKNPSIAAEGVKRIDYFEKNVMFGGLTRNCGDQGFEKMTLITKERGA